MTLIMNISHITTLDEIEKFLKASVDWQLKPVSKKETYEWIQRLLSKIRYRKLRKKEKNLVRKFLQKTTGYSRIQIKRLLQKHREGTLIWKSWQKTFFATVYDENDIALLHKVDSVHRLSGPATKEILRREYEMFGDSKYRKLKNISVSHIYNLRKRTSYLRRGKNFEKTKSTVVAIGKRMKPKPNGRPGFLRVDSVHQGDLNQEKGVCYINMVDEVTQHEFVFSVPQICERYLKIVLEELIIACSFKIINFHSDNGSEYINKVVADILSRLHIKQTKSRPRKHNDNALVETKNGSIIRKTFGYFHIPATEHNAKLLNDFCKKWLNSYLNFHRPCGFATTKIDQRGKEKKIYKQDGYMTPYEKLKSLKNADQYLKRHIFFEDLDALADKESDTEFGLKMNEAKATMFMKLDLLSQKTLTA
jgi:transposase InsO family protein